MKKEALYVLCILMMLLYFHCTEENKDNNHEAVSIETLKKQINVQNFFNTIPSSVKIFQIIQETKLNYNPDYANNPTVYKNYSLERSRALNLGIYGADLAISGAFNQAQESMLFLKCTNF